MKDGVKESSLNRSKQHDFPTPESPISRSLICRMLATSNHVHNTGADKAYQEVVITCPSHLGDDRAVVKVNLMLCMSVHRPISEFCGVARRGVAAAEREA
jgi:hypothetical protein